MNSDIPSYDVSFSVENDSGLYRAVAIFSDGFSTGLVGPPQDGWKVLNDRLQVSIWDYYSAIGVVK